MSNYIDVTTKWLKKSNKNIKIIKYAEYVYKNGKRYYVNNINRIKHENREVENAEWFINIFGGKLLYLPKINETEKIMCADYKYYFANSKHGFFLEEKEIYGKSKNSFYHALEGKEGQANIFLIDCTCAMLNDLEIHERMYYIFSNKRTNYVKTVIIKNNNCLFGIFTRKNKRLHPPINGEAISH